MRKNELSYKSLKNICNPNNFKFETTDDLDSKDLIYGQDRGIKALEFGLDVEAKGYNLYVEGPSGVGKTMYTKNYVNKIAAKKKTPDDWCYIYNFEEPNEPIAVSLPAWKGKEFRDDMDSFIQDIKGLEFIVIATFAVLLYENFRIQQNRIPIYIGICGTILCFFLDKDNFLLYSLISIVFLLCLLKNKLIHKNSSI